MPGSSAAVPAESATAQSAQATESPASVRATPLDDTLVGRIVEILRKQDLGASAGVILGAAHTAEMEISGTRGEMPSLEAVAAAKKIFEDFFSEKNPTVRSAIEIGVRHLGAQNPRQIKRFINLFRFYAFIEAERIFHERNPNGARSHLTDIAKLAALTIRWPNLVSTFTRRLDKKDGLETLEAAAGSDADWQTTLARSRLLPSNPTPDAHRRFDGLRELLRSGSPVAARGRRLL
jgi:hypothetical protein